MKFKKRENVKKQISSNEDGWTRKLTEWSEGSDNEQKVRKKRTRSQTPVLFSKRDSKLKNRLATGSRNAKNTVSSSSSSQKPEVKPYEYPVSEEEYISEFTLSSESEYEGSVLDINDFRPVPDDERDDIELVRNQFTARRQVKSTGVNWFEDFLKDKNISLKKGFPVNVNHMERFAAWMNKKESVTPGTVNQYLNQIKSYSLELTGIGMNRNDESFLTKIRRAIKRQQGSADNF